MKVERFSFLFLFFISILLLENQPTKKNMDRLMWKTFLFAMKFHFILWLQRNDSNENLPNICLEIVICVNLLVLRTTHFRFQLDLYLIHECINLNTISLSLYLFTNFCFCVYIWNGSSYFISGISACFLCQMDTRKRASNRAHCVNKKHYYFRLVFEKLLFFLSSSADV